MIWVFFRITIGVVFIVSGLSKVLSPYQNFLYVIQVYQFLPSSIDALFAQIFPWIELIVGVFVFLGLGTSLVLRAAAVLFGIFVLVVGQALVRHLPLESCGCFGSLIHIPPQVMIVMDSFSLLIVFLMLKNIQKTKKFGLDSNFDKA